MKYTTWTVDVSYYSINNTHYFRDEDEADNFISQTEYILRQHNINDFTITKDAHTGESQAQHQPRSRPS